MPTLSPSQLIDLLTNLPPETRIQVDQTPGSSLSVDILTQDRIVPKEEPQTKADILKAEYADLIGRPISASKAAKKYGVHRRNIHDWKKKGYIEILNDDGYRQQLNEADIAYVVDIYRERKQAGTLTGAPLLDDNGLPYELKHPALSRKRKHSDD